LSVFFYFRFLRCHQQMALAQLPDLLSAGVEPGLRVRQDHLQERLPDEDEEL